MSSANPVAVVFGPALGGVAAALGERAAPVRVRAEGETAADRAVGLRDMLAAGAGVTLLVDTALPVRPDWMASGARYACVSDHLNLTGDNPLVGPNAEEWGPRFPDLTDAWDPVLRRLLREAAVREGVELFEGVVAGVAAAGGSAAELSMYRMMGADMVSTGFIHEAITARHAGRRVAGLAVLATRLDLPGEVEGAAALVAGAVDAIARAGAPPGGGGSRP